MVRAQLELYEELCRFGLWDFAINLSGADLPLRSIEDLSLTLAPYRNLNDGFFIFKAEFFLLKDIFILLRNSPLMNPSPNFHFKTSSGSSSGSILGSSSGSCLSPNFHFK